LTAQVLLAVLIVLQLAMAWWSVCRTASDKIDGFEKGIVCVLEAVATSLLLAANILTHKEGEEDVDIERLTRALELSATSANILVAAVFFPIVILIYNVIVVPVFRLARGAGRGANVETVARGYTCYGKRKRLVREAFAAHVRERHAYARE